MTLKAHRIVRLMQGGDLWSSLRGPDAAELRWYARGRTLALDVARGLHFLHEHKVRGCEWFSTSLALHVNFPV